MITKDQIEYAVRNVADAAIRCGFDIVGCGCCGSVDCNGISFDMFTVVRDSTGDEAEIHASCRDHQDGKLITTYRVDIFAYHVHDQITVTQEEALFGKS